LDAIVSGMKILFGFVLAVGVVAGAQQGQVAQTPPMGWNSWDAYGLTITEPAFRENVKVLQEKLLPFGWEYAVIDEGWFFENPQDRDKPETLHYAIDRNGRYVPVPARFPSAVSLSKPVVATEGLEAPHKLAATIEETSFVDLGKFVHAQGLKFGIHIVRGIPRASVERDLPIANSSFKASDAADQTDACPWDPTNWGVKDNAAGQAWYDSLLTQYAAWGVDLLKVDCIGDRPYKLDEIQMIRRAIDKTGRPMVLSLSPGPMNLSHAKEVGTLANMWRISDDEWDVWDSNGKGFPQGVKDQFARFAAWEKSARPATWPDGDMLPLGELKPYPGWGAARSSRLTPAEQQTQVTLWAIARSPLIVGANLTLLDDATLRLLTNRDVIAIDQTALGSTQISNSGNLIVWRARLPYGKVALALFNVSDKTVKVGQRLADLDPELAEKHWHVRNVWEHRGSSPPVPHGTRQRGEMNLVADIAPHGCLLLMLQ
jgi:hypothetical protein